MMNTVLIADDNPMLRKSLAQMISSMKNVEIVDQAADGHEALAKLRSNVYDLVILDLSMPRITGMKILGEMKKLGIKTKVMVFSLSADESITRKIKALGDHSVVSKTASYAEIKHEVKRIARQIEAKQ